MARYEQYSEKNEMRNGSVVWAYAFKMSKKNDKMILKCKPIKGRLCIIPYTSDNNDIERRFNQAIRPRFFVPFKKNSETEFAWSRAIDIQARCYADTKEEAIEGYNSLIQSQIDAHQKEIFKLKEYKIQEQAPV